MNKTHFTTIALCALGLGFLLWRFPQVLDSQDNQMYLIRCVLLLSFLAPAIHHFGLSRALKYGGAWGGIFVVLFVVYSFHEDLGSVWGRVRGHLLPFSATQNADGSITFIRADDGHFHVEALVNGTPIHFMVDTGATGIALTSSDAERLGFDTKSLSYNQLVNTANGETFTAPVHLAEIKVGPILLKDLGASVNKNLSGASLLGMSFLKRIKSFTVEGERLTLLQ